MLHRALEVVFPRRCAGCGDGAWPFCPRCRDELVPLEPPSCERCGHPWPEPVTACPECPPAPIGSARAPFAYLGPMKASIRRLKFSGWRDVAPALAGAIVALELPVVEAVTWVPLARRRLAERGYDQARTLAEAIALELGLPAVAMAKRTITTTPQARRSADERRRAMQGAFEAPRPVTGRVLLVDDVLTTGATMASCADALVAAGAREVHGAVAARSLRRAALHGSRHPAYPREGPRPGLWLPGDTLR